MRLKIVLLILLLIPSGIQLVFAQQNTYFDQQPVWKIYTQNAHEYPCVRNMNRNQFLGAPVTHDTLIYYPVLERYVLDFGWESDLEPYPHCNGMQTVDSLFKGFKIRVFAKNLLKLWASKAFSQACNQNDGSAFFKNGQSTDQPFDCLIPSNI